jgi:hypothetical protein
MPTHGKSLPEIFTFQQAQPNSPKTATFKLTFDQSVYLAITE